MREIASVFYSSRTAKCEQRTPSKSVRRSISVSIIRNFAASASRIKITGAVSLSPKRIFLTSTAIIGRSNVFSILDRRYFYEHKLRRTRSLLIKLRARGTLRHICARNGRTVQLICCTRSRTGRERFAAGPFVNEIIIVPLRFHFAGHFVIRTFASRRQTGKRFRFYQFTNARDARRITCSTFDIWTDAFWTSLCISELKQSSYYKSDRYYCPKRYERR